MIPIMIGKKEMFIRSEDKQWTLGKMVQSTNKETKEVTQSFAGESFYSSLDGLIRGLLEKKLRAADISSLNELQATIKQAKDELAGMYAI